MALPGERQNMSEPETLNSAQSDGPVSRRVELDEVADTFSELHRKLLTGELPERPFWLEVGDSAYKITDANRDSIALGMLLALDVRGHFRR